MLVVEAPTHFPQCCTVCGTSVGGFVDTLVEKPAAGRVYVCLICVGAIAVEAGWVRKDEMAARVGELTDQCLALEVELQDARDNQVVPLVEVARAIKNASEKQTTPAA